MLLARALINILIKILPISQVLCVNSFFRGKVTFAEVVLKRNLYPHSVFRALHLVAGNAYAFIAIGFSRSILTSDNSAYGIHDIFKAHGQIVKDIQLVWSKAREHDLAWKGDFIP